MVQAWIRLRKSASNRTHESGNLVRKMHNRETGPQIVFLKVESRAARPSRITRARKCSMGDNRESARGKIAAVTTEAGYVVSRVSKLRHGHIYPPGDGRVS